MTELADTFCHTLPRMPLIWDPTRLAPAIACLRKHYYQTYRGLRLNGGPNVHLEWGQVYHECTKLFDNLVVTQVGNDPELREAAIESTLAVAFDLSWDFELKQPRWGRYVDLYQCTDPEYVQGKRDPTGKVLNRDRCKYAKKAHEDIPLANRAGSFMVCANCGHAVHYVSKWFHDHPKKTRGNLLRAVALYCDTPGLVPYAFEDKAPVAEVQHTVPLPINSPDPMPVVVQLADGVEETHYARRPYQLLVNIDSVPEYEDAPAIRERKTTGLSKLDWRFWQQYEMSPQIDTYDLVGNIVYGDDDLPVKMLVEATRVSQSGETEIQRAPIYISEGRRAEWFAELQEVIKDVEQRTFAAADYAEAGLDPSVHFPRRTTACITKNGTCPFWRLCTADPGDRETVIAADYHVEHWNPVTATSTMEEEE